MNNKLPMGITLISMSIGVLIVAVLFILYWSRNPKARVKMPIDVTLPIKEWLNCNVRYICTVGLSIALSQGLILTTIVSICDSSIYTSDIFYNLFILSVFFTLISGDVMIAFTLIELIPNSLAKLLYSITKKPIFSTITGNILGIALYFIFYSLL